jgi:hypothetical protein
MPIRVIEHDPAGTIHLQAETAHGTIEAIADLRIEGDAAYPDQLHLDGPGAGAVGVRDLLRLARELGQHLGLKRLVVQGGVRTTGANPGHLPRPINLPVGRMRS